MAQSIKLGSDTYLDESDVMLDSSSSSRKTIAQARSAVPFSLTYSFTPTQKMENIYYNPLTREVHIEILLYSANTEIPGANESVATIPSGYRPSSTVATYCICSFTDYGTGDYRLEGVNINTDGTIRPRNFLVGRATQVFAMTATYHI